MNDKDLKEIPLCRRCGRKLKSEKSKKQGMGEICYKKSLTEKNHKKLFTSPRV